MLKNAVTMDFFHVLWTREKAQTIGSIGWYHLLCSVVTIILFGVDSGTLLPTGMGRKKGWSEFMTRPFGII
jgi:hypothetical protein